MSDAEASAFQVELQGRSAVGGKTLREAIDAAARAQKPAGGA